MINTFDSLKNKEADAAAFELSVIVTDVATAAVVALVTVTSITAFAAVELVGV